MTEGDIKAAIQDSAAAAKNATRAGFDCVEIYGANGYLVDQFTQDTCNRRTDSWGGSIENRARLSLEVTKAVAEAGMLMKDPYPQIEYLIKELKALNMAYLHLVEPRISGIFDVDAPPEFDLAPLAKLWDSQSPILQAGGFTAEEATKAVDEKYKGYDAVIAFGRYFISNPDLVFRLNAAVGLAQYDRNTSYVPKSPAGYIDYPFSPEFLAKSGVHSNEGVTRDGSAIR